MFSNFQIVIKPNFFTWMISFPREMSFHKKVIISRFVNFAMDGALPQKIEFELTLLYRSSVLSKRCLEASHLRMHLNNTLNENIERFQAYYWAKGLSVGEWNYRSLVRWHFVSIITSVTSSNTQEKIIKINERNIANSQSQNIDVFQTEEQLTWKPRFSKTDNKSFLECCLQTNCHITIFVICSNIWEEFAPADLHPSISKFNEKILSL